MSVLRASVMLAVLLAAGSAQAAHMTNYATNPVEHDDQGRAQEPDFSATGVLGPLVTDCTVDVDGDARCTQLDLDSWPAGQVVAQGCTDDSGRRPSGLCAAPGILCPELAALTAPFVQLCPLGNIGDPPPCGLFAGQRAVRFLDVHQNVMLIVPASGTHYYEVNRKLQDTALPLLEQQLGARDGSDHILPGPTGVWAWHGIFLDKNCNGVIDHSGDGSVPDPDNEFTWVGNCLRFTGGQGVTGDVCRREPTRILAWEFPGNHNPVFQGTCVFLPAAGACSQTLGDTPGSLVLCDLAKRLDGPLDCDTPEAQLGDPLFGVQDSRAPDFAFDDRTGDPRVDTRMWVAGLGWPMDQYDQSLLTTTVLVGAVNPASEGTGPGPNPATAPFRDVDRFTSLSPATDALLQEALKPALRGAWLLVRGCLEPVGVAPTCLQG